MAQFLLGGNHLYAEWCYNNQDNADLTGRKLSLIFQTFKPVTLMTILVSYRRGFTCDVRIPQTHVMVKTTCH